MHPKFARLEAKLKALLIDAPITTANSTAKTPDVHKLNKLVEGKLTEVRPTSEVVSDLLRKDFVAEEWIPNAYVLFIRHWRCRCGATGSCLDRPELFLRHHHIRQRKRAEDDHGPGVRYLPVKVLAFGNLPRLKEVSVRNQVACEVCYESISAVSTFVCQKPNQSNSKPADTALVVPKEFLTGQSESPSLPKRLWNTDELERDLLQYSCPEGQSLDLSVFAESSIETCAPAQDTPTHIEGGVQNA